MLNMHLPYACFDECDVMMVTEQAGPAKQDLDVRL